MEKRRERMEITLCGGKPWGFSIKGGTENNKSIIVSKLENRGKGEASGLLVGDIIICVNDVVLGGIRREAVELIRRAGDRLMLEVERVFPLRGISASSLSRSPHFDNINPGSRMPLVSRFQDEEIFDLQKNTNTNNMNTSFNNNQQHSNRDYNNQNQTNRYPQGYVFSEKSKRLQTSTQQHYEKDIPNKTAYTEKIDIDHQHNTSINMSPSPQKLAEQDRHRIVSRRSAGSGLTSVSNSNEKLGSDEPVPPPRQVAMRRRQQQNKNPERPRSWHASKHPEVEQELRSYIEKSTSQKMTKRRSKEWLETEDLKSTLQGNSSESLTVREQKSFQMENKETQEPSNKFHGSCPDTMNYEELVNYRSEPVSSSRSSLDKSINNRTTDRESLSSESSCSMRTGIESSLGNKFRSSGRYGEIWKLPQNQEHRRARSFDALSEEPPSNHRSSTSSEAKRSSLRKSTGSTGSESSPHIHQSASSKSSSLSKSKQFAYNSEQQSGKEHYRASRHFNIEKGELSVSDTSSSSMDKDISASQALTSKQAGEVKFSYQSDNMVVKLLRNSTSAPKANDFSIIQTKRPKSASSKVQPHLSRTSLSSMDGYDNIDDNNVEGNNTIMPNNDEYKKNIQGMSKKVLRVTSFTRKDLELSPPYQSSLQPLKQEFGFPAVAVQKTFFLNNGNAPVRSKSTSSLLEPVMSTVAIPITPDKTQYCESVSASQSRPHDSPIEIRQSNAKKKENSDNWWIRHRQDSRNNGTKKEAEIRYEDRQQNDQGRMKRAYRSGSPNHACSPPKDKNSDLPSGDKYKSSVVQTSPTSPKGVGQKSHSSVTETMKDQFLSARVEGNTHSKSPIIKTSPQPREIAKSRKLSETLVANTQKSLSPLPDRSSQFKSSAIKKSAAKSNVPKQPETIRSSKNTVPLKNTEPKSTNTGRSIAFDKPQPFHEKAKSLNETTAQNLMPSSSRGYSSPIHKVSPPSPKASHSREGSGVDPRDSRYSPKLSTKNVVSTSIAISPPVKMETSPSRSERSEIRSERSETLSSGSSMNSDQNSNVFSAENSPTSSRIQIHDIEEVLEPSSEFPETDVSTPNQDGSSATHGRSRPRLSDSLTTLPVDREDSNTAVKVSLKKSDMLPAHIEVADEETEYSTNLPKDNNDEVFDEPSQQSMPPVTQSMTSTTKLPTTTSGTSTTTSTSDSSLRTVVLKTPALTNFSNFFMSPTSTLPASSTYYQTSASKGKIINMVQEKVEGGEIVVSETEDTEEDINAKKMRLVTSITNKLSEIQRMKDSIKIDIAENEQLGKVVRQHAEQLCTPREHEKFKTFVEEVDKIFNLILSIAGRLARVENALATIEPEANSEEKNGLLEKKRKLTLQHEEARSLKENVDRRQKLVSEILYSRMSEEQYADFEHYIRMKTLLISEQRELDDKMKLGNEQLHELYDSLPESIQETLPLAVQNPGALSQSSNEQSIDSSRPT